MRKLLDFRREIFRGGVRGGYGHHICINLVSLDFSWPGPSFQGGRFRLSEKKSINTPPLMLGTKSSTCDSLWCLLYTAPPSSDNINNPWDVMICFIVYMHCDFCMCMLQIVMSHMYLMCTMWLHGTMVSMLALRARGRGFESRAGHSLH